MKNDFKLRTIPLFGQETINNISNKTVMVLGLGGVGCTVCESLCRFGVTNFILIDSDKYLNTNLNRQLFATNESIGEYKTKIAKQRLLTINNNAKIIDLSINYNETVKDEIFKFNPDIVIDCIDTFTSKLILLKECTLRDIKIIACMGTGNRIDPTKFKVGKIKDTKGYGCPLSKMYRKECESLNLLDTQVLYSEEIPKKISIATKNGRHIPASSPFCPPVAGFIIANKACDMLNE